MKKIKINNIKNFSLLMVTLFLLSSCLKNGPYYTDFSSVAGSVDLPLAATNANGIVSFSYDATVTTTSLPVYVNVASPQAPASPTTITLAVDTAFLSQYNSANGTDYQVLPDSVYTTSGWTVTVPAGKHLDSMNVTFNFSKMDLSQNYVLPVTISQSSLPIEQWNHLLLYISVKNQFDGEYTVTGSFVDATGSFTDQDVYPVDAYLITTGPNSVEFYDNGNGVAGKVINAGGSLSYFGAFVPVFTIDPSTGKVLSVADAVPLSDASNVHGRYAALDPTGVNQYDLATKTMKVKYIMYQNDIAAGFARVVFDETYTYVGPRH
jgi:hypothetical protein